MPVQIVRNDITKMRVDAIVNAGNMGMAFGGGVCGAIFKAAGPSLAKECEGLGGCEVGQAKATKGYELPARFVIHTVGPRWHGGGCNEAELLALCYKNSLKKAMELGCESIAFPLISSGIFGYPKEKALKVALSTLSEALLEAEQDMEIYIAVFDKLSLAAGNKVFAHIQQYIDDNYVQEHTFARVSRQKREAFNECEELCLPEECSYSSVPLDIYLHKTDESFSQMVLRIIKEKGIKNSDCYKKANIDRKLFSKINSDIHYKPKKTTALAIAVALELPLFKTEELLKKAGFALSNSDKFDIIVKYHIINGKYNIFEINEALFYYDQPLLGGALL